MALRSVSGYEKLTFSKAMPAAIGRGTGRGSDGSCTVRSRVWNSWK